MKVKHVLMIAAVLLVMLAVPAAAETVVTHSVTESYKVSIPESLTVGTAGTIGISGLIDANTQVIVSVGSANGWKLVNNADELDYSLIDENQATVDEDNVLTVAAGNTGEVEVTATLGDDSPKYRGDYTDVLTFTVTQEAQDGESVLIRSYAELSQLINDGGKGLFISNVAVPENTTLTINSGNDITLNLNGYTLSSTNVRTNTHNDFILVKGNLTVSNGQVTYKHTGSNMGWNGCTNVFDVTGGGVLNMDGVTVKNLGGTDMNFAVHMNNWGKVTLNADDCTFDATYCGVRVFNSGYDMNNVKITNSKLTGKTRAFWVHNYIGDLNSAQHSDDAINNRLNIDIYNNNNDFSITGTADSPIRYGFNSGVYYDSNGNPVE